MADENARIYSRIGDIELTVQGGEGETVADIEGEFEKKMKKVIDSAERLEDGDDGGFH